MTNNDFTKLLTKAVKYAKEHFNLLSEVDEECKRRYGCSYSDIDCDMLIDILDINGAEKLTADEFHEMMLEAGATELEGN